MNTLLDRLFPLRSIRNIAMFYVLSVVYNAWVVAGVWVFIWGAFMTKTQIGISDSFTFAVGFLVELPSGIFADLIGRRKAILIGNILLAIGNLCVGLSSSFFGITVWYLIWTIGYAFQSGATEALAYDSLKKIHLESHWPKVISTSAVLSKVSTLICTALGGYLFLLGFRLPYLTAAAIGIIGVIAAFRLRELPVTTTANIWSWHTYISQIKDGIRTLGKPIILPISLLCLTISGVGYMYNWGLLRPLTGERFGFNPPHYSLLLSVTSLIVIIAISLLSYLQKKMKLEKLVFIIGLLYSVSFFVLGFPHRFIMGGLFMISLAVLLTYSDILFSQFINLHTKPEHRATTLSAVALFTKLPYVFLALLIGNIAEKNLLPQYTMVVGIIALAIWMVSYLKQTRLASQS